MTKNELAAVVGFSLAGFCPADHQFAPEEFPVMKLCNRSLGFFQSGHQHEAEPLGPIGFTVGHDFGITHGPDSLEELKEITLCGIK